MKYLIGFLILIMITASKIVLGKNFNLGELTVTNTGLNNTPNAEQISNLEHLVKYQMQPFRDYVGRPVTVTSGFRSASVNSEVGGSKTSDHLKGFANDWHIKGMDIEDAMKAFIASGVPFDQVIIERKKKINEPEIVWIHSSLRKSNNRRQMKRAVWSPKMQKMIYTKYVL